MLAPDVLDLAAKHRLRQQSIAAMASAEVAGLWRFVDGKDASGSWLSVAPRARALMVAAQVEAARGAQAYVAAAVGMQGADSDPAGTVPAGAFAGAASDGRPLDSLLSYPAFEVSAFVDGGMSIAQALGIGANHLQRLTATQIQDAARISTGVATVNDRRTAGYIRVVSASACSRCVVLAGKWYRYSHGFLRHPHCDCVNAPCADVETPQSPKALFDAMSPADLKRAGWSDADVRAINDGGDLYQVTNARRDLRSVSIAGGNLQTTLQGTTRRGLAGQRLGAARGKRAIRLTPESIYAEADRLGWSRDETIRQLKRNGYIL